MAKKGNTPPSKTFKNPLVQALGIALHKMRNELGLSSDDVAAKIGLGGSSYRMIEAGSAMLHPGRSLNIIKVFDKIEYDPLCRLLVAIQVMETGSESLEDLRNATLLVSEIDPQLQQLFDLIEPAWEVAEQQGANAAAQLLEQLHLADALADYLTTNRYFGVEREKRLDFQLNALIEDTPSIYLDFILDTLRSLKKHRLHYFPEESRSWESDNKHNFLNLYAVIKDASGLVSKENFDSFDYNYLWQPQFQQLHYIFMDDDPARLERLRAEFEANLRAALQDKHLKYQVELEQFDEAMRKVHFRSGLAKREPLVRLLKHREEEVPVDVLWIFTLKNGNKVGFMSNHDSQKIFYGTTLSYRETAEKLEAFQSIWEQLA
jgi:DNA-binding XRE family transcriptional regulator